MAKIVRFNGNLVAPASAALGTERTLFGSASQADDLTSQFTADLLRGWGIVGPSDQPTLQDFNAMGYTLGHLHAYLHQVGVPEWNTLQEYHIGSITNVAGVLYFSLINTNVGNNPASSPAQWGELYPQATEAVRGTGVIADNATAVAGVSDTELMTPLKTAAAIAALSATSTDGISGSASNLRVSSTGLSALVTVTADSICVKNSSNNQQKVLNSVSVTPSLAASGVNGLDTGVSAASTWYSVWVIWNGTTTAGLLSLSSSAPTMPSGYTHKARVGWVRSDATANKFPFPFTQFGRRVRYAPAAGSNLTALRQMASGVAGNVNTPTFVAVAWANFAPPTAGSIAVILGSGSNASGTGLVAPNTTYGAANSTTNPAPIALINSSGSVLTGDVPLETANIQWASSTTTATLNAYGWEDNL